MTKSANSRSRRTLIMALMFGLVAALATYAYVDFNTRQVPKPKMATVVVAKADIPAKTQLTPDMLATREVPIELKHPAALESIAEAQNKMVAVPLTNGEQLLTTKFKVEREEKLSLAQLIPQGYRGMAVTFNEVIGTGGLIVPKDRVDVIAVFDAKTMGKDEARIILQDLQVLAVAQAIEGDEEMPVQGNNSTIPSGQRAPSATGAAGSKQPSSPNKQDGQGTYVDTADKATARPQAKSATLAVTPAQAQLLALAEATGKLRLILRATTDTGVATLPEATLDRIKEPAGNIAASRR